MGANKEADTKKYTQNDLNTLAKLCSKIKKCEEADRLIKISMFKKYIVKSVPILKEFLTGIYNILKNWNINDRYENKLGNYIYNNKYADILTNTSNYLDKTFQKKLNNKNKKPITILDINKALCAFQLNKAVNSAFDKSKICYHIACWHYDKIEGFWNERKEPEYNGPKYVDPNENYTAWEEWNKAYNEFCENELDPFNDKYEEFAKDYYENLNPTGFPVPPGDLSKTCKINISQITSL